MEERKVMPYNPNLLTYMKMVLSLNDRQGVALSGGNHVRGKRTRPSPSNIFIVPLRFDNLFS